LTLFPAAKRESRARRGPGGPPARFFAALDFFQPWIAFSGSQVRARRAANSNFPSDAPDDVPDDIHNNRQSSSGNHVKLVSQLQIFTHARKTWDYDICIPYFCAIKTAYWRIDDYVSLVESPAPYFDHCGLEHYYR
jgi:hypothetical protein